MTVEELLRLVDSLAPNNCSEEQKLYWYNQCESMLRDRAVKRYTYLETEMVGGIVRLPDGYSSEDIETLYIGGKAADKLDFRSGFIKNRKALREKIGVVLKTHHTEVVRSEFEGDIYFDGDKLTMEGHPFALGDKLQITSSLFDGTVTVLGVSGNDLFTDKIFETNDCEGKAVKMLDIPLLLSPPYDKLYVDYIMAQMDYYNRDYEGYNNNSYMFNETLNELIRKNTSKAPGNKTLKMHGLW